MSQQPIQNSQQDAPKNEIPSAAEDKNKMREELKTFDTIGEEVAHKLDQEEGLRRLPVPDGEYTARVERTQVDRNRNNEVTLAVVLILEDAGEQSGRRVWYNRTIKPNRESIENTMRDLRRAGLRLKLMSEVVDRLDELAGAHLAIRIEAKNEYRNVYLNRRLDPQNDDETIFAEREIKDAAETLPV